MQDSKIISLRTIAEEADVAIGTVSRVLKGTDQCSEVTRSRVLEIAQRLKYRPNLLVRAVQTGKTQTVGVLTSIDTFSMNILQGIHDFLVANDHVMMVLSSACVMRKAPASGASEREQIHRLIDRRVDGIILYPVEDTADDEYLQEVWDWNLPLVTVDHELPARNASFVGSDDSGGSARVAEFLLGLGHRQIAHLGGPNIQSTSIDRMRGFVNAVKAAGQSCQVVQGKSFNSINLEPARAILGLNPRPTAIFCANDWIAQGIFEVATQMGLRIPQDLTVIGFADQPVCTLLRPMLTTMRQFPYEMGEMAAKLIVDRSRSDHQMPPQKIRVPVELVLRQSHAAAPL